MTVESRLMIGHAAPPLGLVVSFAISTGALGTHPVAFCAIVLGLGFVFAFLVAISFLQGPPGRPRAGAPSASDASASTPRP